MEDFTLVKALYGQDAILKHLKSDLRIVLETKEVVKHYKGKSEFIEGKAILINDPTQFNGKLEIKCRVAGGHLYKLKPVLKGDTVNILDHLDLLLPKFQNCVGLFTYQNGIQNSVINFENMGNKIFEKLPEKPLCIGFYNATNGIIVGMTEDLGRFKDEWHLNAFSVIVIRQMLLTIAKLLAVFRSNALSSQNATVLPSFSTKPLSSYNYNQLFSITSNVLWAHIAHSEAGLIAHEVLTTDRYNLFHQQYGLDRFLKNHLITLTYGAVAPIPDIVHQAINTYSNDDITTRHYGKPFSKKQGYTVKFVEGRVPKKDHCRISGDHEFIKETYQFELDDNIKFIREKKAIYDCR